LGLGRLRQVQILKLANDAEWITTFKKGNKLISSKIRISVASFNSYQSGVLEQPVQLQAGTSVKFYNLKINEEYLLKEIFP